MLKPSPTFPAVVQLRKTMPAILSEGWLGSLQTRARGAPFRSGSGLLLLRQGAIGAHRSTPASGLVPGFPVLENTELLTERFTAEMTWQSRFFEAPERRRKRSGCTCGEPLAIVQVRDDTIDDRVGGGVGGDRCEAALGAAAPGEVDAVAAAATDG